MRADGFSGHENEVVESAAKRAESESKMNDPINQEHEDVLNFAHSLPSGLTKEQIYVRIHERAKSAASADQAAGAVPAELTDDAIFNYWLYRDCMDAIRAGDMKAQFVSAARALLLAASPAVQQPAEQAAAALSDTQIYRTGYGDGVRAAAKLAEEYGAHLAAEAIRNLQSTGPVVAPVPAASEGWTSLDERLPDFNVGVLVTDGKIVTAAELDALNGEPFYWDGHGLSGHDWEFDFSGRFTSGDITHWMPLPAAPATSDKAEG